MKAQGNALELKDALKIVNGAVPRKSPREILQNVLLTVKGNKLTLFGTNLEQGIECSIDLEEAEDGEALVSAELLSKVVKQTKKDEVIELCLSDDVVKVNIEGAEYDIKALPVEEFPPPATEDEYDAEVSVDTLILDNLISRTAFAAAKESIRFAINGVLLVLQDNTIEMVATDGHRLSWAKRDLVDQSVDEWRGIIPLEFLNTLRLMFAQGVATIDLRINKKAITATGDNVTATTKLVEGSYPDYKQVVPQGNGKIINLHAKDLLSGVKQAAVMTSDESTAVKVIVEEGEMTLKANASQGKAEVKRDVQYEGERILVGCNPDYIADIVKAIKTEALTIALKDKDHPILLTAGEGDMFVIMPVTVEDE